MEIILEIRIKRNIEFRMNEFPLFSIPFLKIVFISLCSLFTIMLFRNGIYQILVGINSSPIANLFNLVVRVSDY
jgi:hypothetical protein